MKRIGGRAYLVARLQARRLSRRQSVRVLNLIFTEMQRALKHGRLVEFPLGKLKRVRSHFSKYWDAWPADRRGWTAKWQQDEAGELSG